MFSPLEVFGLISAIIVSLYAIEAVINLFSFSNREDPRKLPYQVYGNFNPYRHSSILPYKPSTMSNREANHEH